MHKIMQIMKTILEMIVILDIDSSISQ